MTIKIEPGSMGGVKVSFFVEKGWRISCTC